ncbi:OsmC family protein [Thiomonas sp. FB-Cd]|uniref:OsmC family protein n=1 Tax=Thiomonas sp. FB-Cd TaxID=1158292 RepID=UPI00068D3211|nr:OsmC family protein [Thiomonas sp. FB-Cd]
MELYRDTPAAALVTLKAEGNLAEGISCKIETGKALGIELRGATLRAEGDLDFRGTLGVSKAIPVGFQDIRLTFDLDTDASEEQLETLLRLTERYCVVYQTLVRSPALRISHRTLSSKAP